MNYELALELKKAGFPQRSRETVVEHIDIDGNNHVDPVSVPTLSELIEACGEEFYALEATHIDGIGWKAYADAPNNTITTGKTHSEAVARLWLALHAKSN